MGFHGANEIIRKYQYSSVCKLINSVWWKRLKEGEARGKLKMCISLDCVGPCPFCNSASWSAVLAETPTLIHRLAYQKEQQCRWRSAGNLSEAHCPAVAPALKRVPSTRSSNIQHPPPLGRRKAGRSSGKATPDRQNAASPAGVGGRRERERGWRKSSSKREGREKEEREAI